MILAILRAQLLSMRSFRLDSRRRGAIFSILTAVVWYGFWAVLAFIAEQFTVEPSAHLGISRGLAIGLMLIFLYWQLAPMISASMGASLDLKKLLVYPVPHQKLFVVEVLLRLTTCMEMILLLAGAFIGLIQNPAFGAFGAAPRVAFAFLMFVVFNLLLAAGIRSFVERLLLHKRLREIVMLFLVLLTAVPQLLLATKAVPEPLKRWFAGTPALVWPWAAASRVALGEDGKVIAALTLAAWIVIAYAFGRWQFERSLRYSPEGAVRNKPTGELKKDGDRSWIEGVFRLPGFVLPDPLAAIVEKELRSLSRTPRFRMVFIMGFSFGLIVWFPMAMRHRSGGESSLATNFLTLVSVYALTLLGQVSYLNAFGFDRSAAQVYFSLPVSIAKSLAGKNLAASFFILLEMIAVTSACLLLRIGIPAMKIAEAFMVTAIVGLYLLAIGNLSSVHFPRAMNPEKVAQGGAASRMQGLIFLFYPVALLPVFLAFWARHVFESEFIFYVVLSFAALLGAVFYWVAMESAVSAAVRRREKILTELSRSDGPVVTE
jgi:ABC-2 type transport system permease protein